MSKLLKLSNVNLNYTIDSKSINILKNISFDVDYKETISVVGESGSGKTSLIMLIGGLEKVSSGNIFFRDSELSKMNEDEISEIRRKNIGIVFQSFYLIPNFTALENVSLSLEINKFNNSTIIMITHRLSIVVNANKILVFEKGYLSEQGDHESLLKNKSVYCSLLKNEEK